MARLPILEFPDPRLRTRARPVVRFDAALGRLVDDMLETMYAARGIGLAATQVDVHLRLLVMDVAEEGREPREYLNPELLAREGSESGEEGCLSVPEVNARVTRATRVRVRAQDRRGEWFERELEGLAAVCLQHEMDHLEGRLFVDYLSTLRRERIRRKLEKDQRARAAEAPAGARAG